MLPSISSCQKPGTERPVTPSVAEPNTMPFMPTDDGKAYRWPAGMASDVKTPFGHATALICTLPSAKL